MLIQPQSSDPSPEDSYPGADALTYAMPQEEALPPRSLTRRLFNRRLGVGAALAAVAVALGVKRAEASCWTQYAYTPISPCRSYKYHRTCCDYICGTGPYCCDGWVYDGIVSVNNCAYYGRASCCCTTCP